MTKAGGVPARVLFLVVEPGVPERAEDLPRKPFSEAGVDVVIATPARLAELSDADIARFAGMLVPDDPGAPADLAGNADARRVLRILHGKNAPIASVGRGTAVLLSAPPNGEGQWLFDGYRLTSYAGDEVPWQLDVALKAAGAVFEETATVVVDRNLVTARNAGSAGFVAGAVLDLMAAKGHQ
jgi:putative intracellular protease/amidase